MKRGAQLLFTYCVFGVIQHVYEVHAHKTIDDDEIDTSNFGQQEQVHASEDASDTIQGGLDDQGNGVFQGREIPDFMEMELPETRGKTVKDKLIQFLSHEPQWYWKYYSMELMFLAAILSGFINFFKGKNMNSKIAWDWRKSTVPSLFHSYTHLGCAKEPKNIQLVQRSYSEFDYFASGRANCYYTLFRLEMMRRQCLLTNYVVDPYLGR